MVVERVTPIILGVFFSTVCTQSAGFSIASLRGHRNAGYSFHIPTAFGATLCFFQCVIYPEGSS